MAGPDTDRQINELLVQIASEKDPAKQRALRQGLAEVASPMKRSAGPSSKTDIAGSMDLQLIMMGILGMALAGMSALALSYKSRGDSLQQQNQELQTQLEAHKWGSVSASDAGAVVQAVWPWQWPWQVQVGVSIFLFLGFMVLATLLGRGGKVHGPVRPGRLAPVVEGDFVLLLLGIKPHSLLKFWKWMPIVRAMVNMGRELEQKKDSGFLGYEVYVGLQPLIIQYWRSFEHMRSHPAPKWVVLTQRSQLETSLGVWHETYLIRAGDFEGVYSNMPDFGLGKVGTLVDAKGKLATAAGRLGLDGGASAGMLGTPAPKVPVGVDSQNVL